MFTLIAKITINEGFEETVKNELQKLIKPSRIKEGCLSYSMYTDKKNPNLVFFIEKWANNESFGMHMKSDLIVNYSKKTQGMVKNIELNKIDEIMG